MYSLGFLEYFPLPCMAFLPKKSLVRSHHQSLTIENKILAHTQTDRHT